MRFTELQKQKKVCTQKYRTGLMMRFRVVWWCEWIRPHVRIWTRTHISSLPVHSLFIYYTAHCSLLHNVCLWAVRGTKFWSNYRVGTDTDLPMDEIILNNDMRIHLRMESKGKIGKMELKTSNRSTRGSSLLFCTVILLLLFILLSPYII